MSKVTQQVRGRRGGPRPAGSSLGSALSPAHLAKAGLDRPEWGPGGRPAAPAAEGAKGPVEPGGAARGSRLAFRAPSRPASPDAPRPFSVPWGRGRAAGSGVAGAGPAEEGARPRPAPSRREGEVKDTRSSPAPLLRL